MTTSPLLSDSVGSWVTKHPATSRIFEQYQIDYCCGGGRPLEEACSAKKLDSQKVLNDLHQVIRQDTSDDSAEDNFASKSLVEMCDSIEATHHEYLRRELPRLTQLVDKVVSVHGDRYAWLNQLGASFQQLRDELNPHMLKEEQILFPAIRTIEQSQSVPSFSFGTLDNPIHMMEHEHDVAGQALRDIREASSDFTLPDGGCNTFRAMLDGLHELERDLHRHIHKENNVLFPSAAALAKELHKAPSEARVE